MSRPLRVNYAVNISALARMKSALIAIANGSEDIETVTVIDVLRRAQVDVNIASVEEKVVTMARGTVITADSLLSDAKNTPYDMIVLPGGMPGASTLSSSKDLLALLTEQKKAGKYIAAICAAPAVVLGPHGLLRDVSATCYPSFMEKMPKGVYSGAEVVVSKNISMSLERRADGRLVTSQGPGTANEFALCLVEALCGFSTAEKVAKGMLLKAVKRC